MTNRRKRRRYWKGQYLKKEEGSDKGPGLGFLRRVKILIKKNLAQKANVGIPKKDLKKKMYFMGDKGMGKGLFCLDRKEIRGDISLSFQFLGRPGLEKGRFFLDKEKSLC